MTCFVSVSSLLQ